MTSLIYQICCALIKLAACYPTILFAGYLHAPFLDPEYARFSPNSRLE